MLTPSEQRILSCSILVVDDDETERVFLCKALTAAGYRDVRVASDGSAALRRAAEHRPDLIILDLMMPVMDGYECCRTVRRDPALSRIPILVLTGMRESEDCVAAFEAGATDFVRKPIIPDELRARMKSLLEQQLSLADLRNYRERVAVELESARELQSAILPDARHLEDMGHQHRMQIAATCRSCSELGGDFWGMRTLYPSQFALWIADFSGHGVASALNAFRLHAYMAETSDLAAYPGSYLTRLNEKLLPFALHGQFATLFYGVVDRVTQRLHYAASGCPPPILLRQDGGTELLDTRGLPLGVALNSYPTHSVPFGPGDTIFLYSDALVESMDDNGAFLAETDVTATCANQTGNSATTILQAVEAQFNAHVDDALLDDLTLVVCRRVLDFPHSIATRT